MSNPLDDPVALEIMWSRLIAISEECWATIWRTAFSLIVGEAQDVGCEWFDARGQSLAHAPRSMPVFNLTLPNAVRALLEVFPPATLADGDVLITNDPWLCAGHLFDVVLVTPVFYQERLVALVGSVAHCSDIGGTRDSLAVREIYEEGLQIPPLKLYRAGTPNHELLAMIEANVRTSAMVLGDLQAQVSANRVGVARLQEFLATYQLDSLDDLATVIQQRTEQAMRRAIRALPAGEYRHSVTFEGIGSSLTLPVRVVVAGDSLLVDWSGAPPQLAQGGINCTLSYTTAHSVYALKCLLTPEVPSNAGCFRPITVTAPEGSILNCRYPAAVNQRTITGWHSGPAIIGALAAALPERAQAFSGLPVSVSVYGTTANGQVFNDHLFQGGGQGASAHSDGRGALLFPTSAANTSVELFELRTPLLVEQKALIADSGGPGRQRGGLGQRVQVRKLYDDGLAVWVGVHLHGGGQGVPGLFGGQEGASATMQCAGLDETSGYAAAGALLELRTPAQQITVDLAGGSGFGSPSDRALAAMQADLDAGFVTHAGVAVYGCSVTGDGIVQHEALQAIGADERRDE